MRFIGAAGTTQLVTKWDPKPGDIVSFKHRGFLLYSKKPKLPTIYRVRLDITWEDVLKNWKERKLSPTGEILQLPPRMMVG